jgi:Na+/proline symporter
MDEKIVWLFVFVGLYWGYCIYWGVKSMSSTKTTEDYFIVGRSLPFVVFILAVTATSFSGWTFMGHPGLVYRDGFQYAYASFYAITIPLTGVFFMKRQWMLGKRYGFVTPGEMFFEYYKSDTIRILVVLVALMFSVPYLAVQLRASGFLFNILTDGNLSIQMGMWLLSFIVVSYVFLGGLRAVAYVDSMQLILLATGIVAIGAITFSYVVNLNDGIVALTQLDQKRTPEGYSHYIAIPGVIQTVSHGPSAVGGAWTGVMILTYMFALMGIQASPAFSMWAFSNKTPKPFAPQQVWASSFVIGLIFMVFTAIQGMGTHFLGADVAFKEAHPGLVNNIMGPLLEGKDLMNYSESKQDALVPLLIRLMGDAAPWLLGLLAVCALAAMQSTGAAYMSTAGGILTRDILKRYVMPKASNNQQIFWGRLGVIVVTLAALVVATSATDALSLLGGLAVAYGLQMLPALIGICWWPWLTRQGVVVGMIAGIIAVTLTGKLGAQIMPWGTWPLTIHSAGWGIFFNIVLTVIVSAFTQNDREKEERMKYHTFLKQSDRVANPARQKKILKPVAWIIILVWFIFAIGPGAVIGNTVFGDPNDPSSWIFGIPSIWAWQFVWWAIGVFMMWLLAYKMELSTMSDDNIKKLDDDIKKYK